MPIHKKSGKIHGYLILALFSTSQQKKILKAVILFSTYYLPLFLQTQYSLNCTVWTCTQITNSCRRYNWITPSRSLVWPRVEVWITCNLQICIPISTLADVWSCSLIFDPEFLYFLKTNHPASWTAGFCLLGRREPRGRSTKSSWVLLTPILSRRGQGRAGWAASRQFPTAAPNLPIAREGSEQQRALSKTKGAKKHVTPRLAIFQ